MAPGIETIQEALNATRPLADCYCLDIQPIWDFIYSVITSPNIPLAISCYYNAFWGFGQIWLASIIHLEAPNSTHWAEEATCAFYSIGFVVEDTVLAFVEMLIGLLNEIEDLISSAGVDARSTYYSRVAALHATANSILLMPASIRQMQATPGAVPMRGLTMVWLSAANDAIIAAHGKSQALFHQTELNNDTLILTWGLDAILRVANTHWSLIFTTIPVLIVGGINMTIMALSNAPDAFGSPAGLAFFQLGVLGDETRYVKISRVFHL
jgi:hypothetical protein